MKKDYNNLSEIEFVRNWCITIIDFMTSLSTSDKELEAFKPMRENLLKEYDLKDKKVLKGFKGFFTIMNDWAFQLHSMEYSRLNEILIAKFGKGLDDINNKNIRVIKAIKKRGKIINEEEYKTLLNRADEIGSDDSQKDELNNINKLLIKYLQN